MDESASKRIFFAIELSAENLEKIQQLCQELKKYYHRLHPKWVALNNIHLTVRFIGDTTGDKIALISRSCKQQLMLPQFSIKIKQSIIFPANKPRILALNVQLTNEIAELYRQINHLLHSFDFAPDNHPFLPHITLARAREQVFNAPPPIKFNLQQEVKHISLFASTLTNEGSHYQIIERFELG